MCTRALTFLVPFLSPVPLAHSFPFDTGDCVENESVYHILSGKIIMKGLGYSDKDLKFKQEKTKKFKADKKTKKTKDDKK